MKFIKEADWLAKRLHERFMRIIDCSFILGKPEEGWASYKKSHIPGAIYFDLERDMSGPVGMHGGRHPMPDLSRFKDKLEEAGISNDTVVVAYDQGGGAFSARLWWMLKYVGHKEVYVLDGGFAAWQAAGFATDHTIPAYQKSVYHMEPNQDLLASHEDVEKVVNGADCETVLIDSREEKRYLGIAEPIDRKAGHIPGAVNKDWAEGLKNGKYRSPKEQEKRFVPFPKDKPMIVYCGSGVTAAPNFIALKVAGYENVKLYVGSFSDWISYEEHEISTGKK